MPELEDVLESTNLPGTQESTPSGSSNTPEGGFPFGAPPAGEGSEVQGKASEGAPADDVAGELEKLRSMNADLDAKLTHSRQEMVQYKQRMADLAPIIDAGMKATNGPQGQVQQSAQQAPKQQDQQKAFYEAVRQIVREESANTWDQKNYDSRQMHRLNKRATSELDGFEKMQEHPAYIDMVNSAIYLQDRGTLAKGEDPTYSAMEYAHKWFLASNPEYMKAVKETGKKEALDKAKSKAEAEAAGGTSKSADIGGERALTAEEQGRVDILKGFRTGRRRLPSARG